MPRFNVQFVVVNQIPTSTDQANDLSVQMNLDHGRDGWKLVSMMSIPGTQGMLLVFQKELPD